MSTPRTCVRLTVMLLTSMVLACTPLTPTVPTAVPIDGPNRSCDSLFGFLDWGLAPGITPKSSMDAHLEAKLGDSYANQRSTIAEHREQITFAIGDISQDQDPSTLFDLFLRDGILQRVLVHWRGAPQPTAHTILMCLGAPEFVDAAFIPDTQMRYDVVVWYPQQGLRVGSVNYVRSLERPNLGDGQVFTYAVWVAPGSPIDMLRATDDSMLSPVPLDGYNEGVLARMRPWTGLWEDVEVMTIPRP